MGPSEPELTRNELEVNREWTGSEPEVNQEWTWSGPEVDRKWTWMWTSSEHKVNWKWAGSEPEMNWKWAWIEPIVNQKWTGEVEYALQFLKQGYWFTFKIYPPKVSLNVLEPEKGGISSNSFKSAASSHSCFQTI